MGKDIKKIAVIVDTMDGVYQSRISNGLIEYAKNKNINLIFYSGMAKSSRKNLMSEHNAVFQLFNKDIYDGIIYLLGSLEIYVGRDGIEQLARRCGNLPAISLSLNIDGAKSIVFDNYNSMYKITQHILTKHNYKRIAYISGSLKNDEAISRYNGFKAAMNDGKTVFNNQYFFEGDFLTSSGARGIDYFVNNPLAMPDVIIIASDEMAIGALMRLKELGYDVPNEVALTGFDNIETSKSFFPSITTINQPSAVMSKYAIEYIDQLLSGHSDLVPNEKLISGELIIRESCGCSSIVDSVHSNKRKMDILTIEDDSMVQIVRIREHKAEIVDMLIAFINLNTKEKEKLNTYFGELIDGLVGDIEYFEIDGEFLRIYSKIMNYTNVYTNINCDWQRLMLILRNYLCGIITSIEVISFIDELFLQIGFINGSNLSRKETLEHFLFKRMYITSRAVSSDLNEIITLEDLKNIIRSTISEYGISVCFLCLYDDIILCSDEQEMILPVKTRLVIGYVDGAVVEDEYYFTKNILPDRYISNDQQSNLVILTLFDNEYHYGYIVFSLDAIDMLIYETLRGQISNALKRKTFYEERQAAEEELDKVVHQLEISNAKLHELAIRDELTGLYNRRGFYQQVDKFLKTNISKDESYFVLFGDIDGLKGINDSFGHREGDYTIYTTATILKNTFGEEDIIARMSGDEFTIVITRGFTEEMIRKLLVTLENAFAEHNMVSKKPYKVAITIGYAAFSPDLPDTIDDIIKAADSNLYIEKAKKRAGIIKR